MSATVFSRLIPAVAATLKRGFEAWVFVTKLTVPAMILTRLLLYFDLVDKASVVFQPLMAIAGLPPESALVWVSAMLGGLYVAITVYLSLMPVMDPFTLSQITALGCLCLLAHNIIVEGQVCRATGVSFWRVSVFRIGSALLMGLIIRQTTVWTGWGSEPAVLMPVLNVALEAVPPWSVWALGSLKQLLLILVLVEALMLLMDVLKYLKITRLISKILGPPLRLAGIGENAVMVTVIGCVVGLSLGGGLIVAESRSGTISPPDIFGAIMLMAVFHSLVEDTLLMWALGGSMWWLVGARLVLSLFLVGLITRLSRRPRWRAVLVGGKLPY